MSEARNVAVWFEIPAADFERATGFLRDDLWTGAEARRGRQRQAGGLPLRAAGRVGVQ
ncbi:MAG: hypothetical protein WDN31_16900 [Hyphomicrobium sp.]